MAFTPKIRLHDSTGTSVIFTFPLVQNHNAPHSSKKFIKQSNFRSQGEIIIEGGEIPWELTISFILFAEGYVNIAAAIETLESAVALNVPYLIRIDTSLTTFLNQSNGGYKVKRLKEILYPNRENDLMNDIQRVEIRFDVNAW